MIQHVSFRNFKALRQVDVPLERLTVFVGANASGKTSVLQGLNFLQTVAVHQQIGHEESIDHLVSKGGQEDLIVAERLPEGSARVVVCPASVRENGLHSTDPVIKTQRWRVFLEGRTGEDENGWKPLGECPDLVRALPRAALLRFEARRLAQPYYSESVDPTLESDGTGLPAVLASMALTHPEEFSRLQADLQKVIPAVRRVRFEKAKVTRQEVLSPSGRQEVVERDYIGDAVLFDMAGAASVTASEVSEGTLLVLSLLTVLHTPPQPDLVLLDDLGHGLHPRAQWDLIAVLRQIMEQRPALQIVATTHSPYLLDKLHAEEVRLTTMRDDGSVACGCMTDHPDFERWKAEFKPGEFWSFIGEKWVANREPVEATT